MKDIFFNPCFKNTPGLENFYSELIDTVMLAHSVTQIAINGFDENFHTMSICA